MKLFHNRRRLSKGLTGKRNYFGRYSLTHGLFFRKIKDKCKKNKSQKSKST